MLYFVGGYYKQYYINEGEPSFDRLFVSPEIFDLETIMNEGFVGTDFINNYHVDNDIDEYEGENRWDNLSDDKKAKLIMDYTSSDELAGLILCPDLNTATEILKESIDNIKYFEEEYSIVDIKQNREGYFIDVYEKNNARNLNIIFGKNGGNASKNSHNCKLTLPNSWISSMSITEKEKGVLVTFSNDNQTIVISKQ